MTSAAPLRGLANYVPYSTARGAANSMVQSLALELAPDGVLVNAVAPNYIATETYFPKRLLEDEAALAKVLAIAPACLRRTDTTRPKTIMFAMYMYAATGIDAVSSTPCCAYIRGRRACLCGSCHVCGMPSCRAGPHIMR